MSQAKDILCLRGPKDSNLYLKFSPTLKEIDKILPRLRPLALKDKELKVLQNVVLHSKDILLLQTASSLLLQSKTRHLISLNLTYVSQVITFNE